MRTQTAFKPGNNFVGSIKNGPSRETISNALLGPKHEIKVPLQMKNIGRVSLVIERVIRPVDNLGIDGCFIDGWVVWEDGRCQPIRIQYDLKSREGIVTLEDGFMPFGGMTH